MNDFLANFAHDFDLWFILKLVLQVLILSYFAVWGWQRLISSQAERLVKGVLVIAGIWGLCYAVGFTLITSMLQLIVPVAFVALVIVFQPELRRGLGHLGRMQAFRLDWSLTDAEEELIRRDASQIISAISELSRSRTGALIVIEPSEGERDYISPGTTVNADISTAILLAIFHTSSPLHDGATIIRQRKIVASGVILPMTEDQELSFKYGTRHRAAIGLSELYDGLCIVVSEETGAISAASRGMLARYTKAEDLKAPIVYLLSQGGDSKSVDSFGDFLSLFGQSTVSSTTVPAVDEKLVEEDKANNHGPIIKAKPEIG